jgi:ABC-type transport system substrate-binding protein
MFNRRQQSQRRVWSPLVFFVLFCGSPLAALLVLAQLAPLLASSAPQPAIPKRGGTLRLANSSDIRSLDPTTVYDWLEGVLAMMLYRPLLDYDENEQLVPMLAESLPTISPDSRTYTFRLKPGVLFSNGREVLAEDVVYSLERHLDPKNLSSYVNYYLNIAGAKAFMDARHKESRSASAVAPGKNQRWIEPTHVAGLRALDRHTVQIELDQPDFIFSDITATPYSVVVPQEEVEKPGPRFAQHPVGCGPFVLKEWKRGVRLRLERNPRYFLAGRPYVEAVEVFVGVDESTEVMMFERGELDWLRDIPDSDFLRLKRHPQYHDCLAWVEGCAPTYISLNCELPPLTDRRVRQALNCAVDKDRLLKVLLHRGVAACGVLPSSIKGFNPNLRGYPYDPNKARSLLVAAGCTNGPPIQFLLSEDWMSRKIAVVVEHDLRKLGVKLDVQLVNTSVLLNQGQTRKRVPMAVWDWIANFNDPKDTLDLLVNGDRITEEGCLNVAFYSNPQVNELFRQAAREMDAAKRLQLYREIERLVVEDAPWIFLCNMNRYQLRQPWLKGFKMRAVWPQRLENVWLDTKDRTKKGQP